MFNASAKIQWYYDMIYMSPDIGIVLLPPQKKNKNIVRESGNHRPVISTLMDQEGLLPPVRFGEFTAMYGKSEAKECSGNPGSVHEKTRGTAESNLVTSGRTKSLLGSRSYHNTRIPSWFFGEDVNDCECIYMYLFWGWFGDGWRGTTCVFLKLAYYAWYFTYFGYVLWSSKPTWFVFFPCGSKLLTQKNVGFQYANCLTLV